MKKDLLSAYKPSVNKAKYGNFVYRWRFTDFDRIGNKIIKYSQRLNYFEVFQIKLYVVFLVKLYKIGVIYST